MDTPEALVSCYYSAEQTLYERHFHNAYEVIYVCAGTALFRIGDASYRAGPHSLVFISKLEEHSVRILEGGYRRYCALLSSVQLDRMLDDPELKSVFISRPEGFRHCFDVSPIARSAESVFAGMAEEFGRPGPFSGAYLAALFRQLMILCYREKREQFPRPAKSFGSAVFEAQKYIDRSFTQELSLGELARRFYLSPSYLSHAFRDWTGYSPKQYIMLSRLSYAKELLLTTDLGVAEISARSGFGDVNNFIRSFKRLNGVTPNRYRRRNA